MCRLGEQLAARHKLACDSRDYGRPNVEDLELLFEVGFRGIGCISAEVIQSCITQEALFYLTGKGRSLYFLQCP